MEADKGDLLYFRINKLRETCLTEFDAHWQCLEKNNQVRENLTMRL